MLHVVASARNCYKGLICINNSCSPHNTYMLESQFLFHRRRHEEQSKCPRSVKDEAGLWSQEVCAILFLQIELFFLLMSRYIFFFSVNLGRKLGLWLSRIRVLSRFYYLLSTLDWVWGRLRKVIRQQLASWVLENCLEGRLELRVGELKI